MFELIQAGGWVMYPIILSSILALTIISERFWSLQQKRVIPRGLSTQVWQWVKDGTIDKAKLDTLRQGSLFGKLLAAMVADPKRDRESMKTTMIEVASQITHELEKYLNALGTIAEISPLLGLLGTVTGIIQMLAAIGEGGLGNPAVLSSGLAEALITTAAGLIVAIPTFIAYRYFRGRVDALTVQMEQEALKIMDVLQRERSTRKEENK